MGSAAQPFRSCVSVWVVLLGLSLSIEAQQTETSAPGQAFGSGIQHQAHHAVPSRRTISSSLPLSSYECVFDDGKAEHRVCIFRDIVLWEGQLLYVADGEELLPDIDINWLEPERLQIQVIQQESLPRGWSTAEVNLVPEALLGHHVNYLNYYHVFIETLPTWHNVICKYLGNCNYDRDSTLQLWLLEERGPGAYANLTLHPAALKPLYSCLSPLPPHHVKEEASYGKVVIFKKAIAGMGPDVQAFHQWRPRWPFKPLLCIKLGLGPQGPWFFDNWVVPPANMMHLWRHRLAQCLATPFDTATVSKNPLRVTIVNRPYKAGRHILNVQELQAKVLAKWPGSVVRVVHIEQLDLMQQIALLQQTSLLIWTHGAAMADLLFLPQGGAAVELVPWPHAEQAHEWAQSIQSHFSLNIHVAWTRLTDASHLHYHTEVLFKNVIWQGLSAEERLLFLENGICPGDPNTPLNTVCRNEWMHYLVSFVQPWEPLEDVLDTLHLFVQSQKS